MCESSVYSEVDAISLLLLLSTYNGDTEDDNGAGVVSLLLLSPYDDIDDDDDGAGVVSSLLEFDRYDSLLLLSLLYNRELKDNGT